LFGLFFLAGQLYSQNRQTIDSLKIAISTAEPDTNKINLLTHLAHEYNQINNDTSIYYLKQALDLARETEAPYFKAAIFGQLGMQYSYKADYFAALEHLDLALDILKVYTNYTMLTRVHFYKSFVYLQINKPEDAGEQAGIALELAKKENNHKYIILIYDIYSQIFSELGEPEKALEFSLKTYHLYLEQNDSSGLAAASHNLSYQYAELEQIDSAQYYLRKAIQLNKKFGNMRWLANNYQNMSDHFLVLKQPDSAAYYLDLATENYHKTKYYLTLPQIYYMNAWIELLRGDTAKAIEHYMYIIDSITEYVNLSHMVTAYQSLAKIAQDQNRYQDAFHFYEKYKLFDDSLKKETNTSLVKVLEVQIDYDKRKNQMELAHQKVITRSQRKNFYIILLVGLVVVLLTIVWFVIRLQRAKAQTAIIKQQKLEEELEFKNREMTSNVMALMKKNELMSEISKKLLLLEENAVKDETKDNIRKIAREISNLQNVELWEEFDSRFKQVHSDFYKKLNHQFPDLSPAEQRICAFLKMNMSTKDIAELTGKQILSINNSRSRIRTKLGLNPDDNLVSFLTKI
jgi:tetratricopeptide (TPR) repeat protein